MAKYLIIAVVFVGIAIWIVGWVMNPGDDETITGKESVPASTATVEPLLEGNVQPAIWTKGDSPPAWLPASAQDHVFTERMQDLMATDVITGMGLKPTRLYVNADNWNALNDLERQTIGQMVLMMGNRLASTTDTSVIILSSDMIKVPQNEWKPLGQITPE